MAASKRKKTSRQRGASRGRQRTPAWLWLLTGILIGLGSAYYLWAKGYIPSPPVQQPVVSDPAPKKAEPPIAEQVAEQPEYDFFTVLPEMEVTVPEQELAARQESEDASRSPESADLYLLQVGSFRQNSDADQMKARLALLGMVAQIQSVTVNENTWHRVRVGPVQGSRAADDMRQRLAENGIDSLVMKSP
jgi:cell division protein FtsN